jgi:HD-GYP domain-containing protein (c-di-GMP phosphodiesterase class II)
MKGLIELIACIQDISAGKYSNDIMALTGEEYGPLIRQVAESVGLMMVRIEAREFELEQAHDDLKRSALETVSSAARALGLRDSYTSGHGDRVGCYASRLAARAGYDEDFIEQVRIAGVLHDMGKIGFSDTVFSNTDTCPDEEMLHEIRLHPQWGYDMLQGLSFLRPSLEYIRCHHERMDGTGYPRGLHGDEIPDGAKIISIADVFDAITTNRNYQKARKCGQAFDILRKLAGPSLDPKLVEVFIDEIEQNGMQFCSDKK